MAKPLHFTSARSLAILPSKMVLESRGQITHDSKDSTWPIVTEKGERPGGGTLGISGWECAARTLEPLAYTRASFSWILLPYTRVNSWFP